MNGISHKQARRYMLANLDGLLSESQRSALEKHLAGCETCRADSESLSTLTSRLQSEFHARWDAYDGPSQNVTEKFYSQTRRIIMSNKIKVGLSAVAGMAVLVLVLVFVLNTVLPQRQEAAILSSETQITDQILETSYSDGLIAFTSAIENGNLDVYTMRPDGSSLTNLTNNPAHDVHPVWSPDGKRIAFESDRDGYSHIYVMNANGSSLVQLSNSNADDRLGDKISSVWSPDGKKLLFISFAGTADIYVANADGSEVTHLTEINVSPATTPNLYWSPDGANIAYIANDPLDPMLQRIYIMDTDGSNPQNITSQLQANENISETGIRWADDGKSVFYIASINRDGHVQSVVYEVGVDGNSLTERAKTDTPMIAWQEGVSILPFYPDRITWTWLQPDGSSNTLNPFGECQGSDGNFSFEQSSKGNLAIGVSCQNGQWRIYEVDSNGTALHNLQESPIQALNNPKFFWSPDDSYIAFNVVSSDKTDLYILNIEEAINNPSVRPVQVVIGGGELHFLTPSWQP